MRHFPVVTANVDADVTSPRVTMGHMRILVVEDEPLVADAVATWLRGDAHAVDVVHDGAAALERLGVNDYDVVVLDRDLPVVHGDEVCRAVLAGGGQARVLMLTAAAELDDRVAGLVLGADDYLPKPFAFAELSARVTALGRRSRPAAPPVLQRAGIRLDPHRREVFRDGRYVPLSRKEFAVLTELLRADGAAVTAEHLLEKAWDEHADPFTHAIRMTILKLRRKLGDPPVVLTEPGVGYRIR
jgi:DNA-binding response OmpR family regulator